MKSKKLLVSLILFITFAVGLVYAPVNAQTTDGLVLVNNSGVLEWHTGWVDMVSVLNITNPQDKTEVLTFQEGVLPTYSLKELGDGVYLFTLAGIPHVDYVSLSEGTVSEDGRVLTINGLSGQETYLWNGSFVIINGNLSLSNTTLDTDITDNMVMDQVVADDMIIQSSLCVGMDCVNGESFSFDTMRLKENNLRIRFMDTSNSGSFPTNDWEITVNDSTNGGANYFAITDIDGSRKPFLIEAGARNNALYVDSSGRVGLGTNNPSEDLHILYGDTPTIRLDQQGGGWTPQIWDLAGNEANFFIRDVTNGGKLVFRIQPGAPVDSLTVKNDGKVGIGTWSPGANLEIRTTNTPVTLRLNRTDGHIWDLSGGADKFSIVDSTDGLEPFVIENGAASNTLVLSSEGNLGVGTDDPTTKLFVSGSTTLDGAVTVGGQLDVSGNASVDGNLVLEGYLSERSDVNAKENFKIVSGSEVLEKISQIPVTTWNYIDDAGTTHIGPMAQDFYAAFGVGLDDKHLSALDVNGVALASIQELNKIVEEKDAEISDLQADLNTMEARLSALEAGTSGQKNQWGLPFAFGLGGVIIGALVVKKRK